MVKTEGKYSAFTPASGRILAMLFLAIFVVGTILASAMSTYTVNVEADGAVIKVTTSEQSAQKILDQAGVTLGEKIAWILRTSLSEKVRERVTSLSSSARFRSQSMTAEKSTKS